VFLTHWHGDHTGGVPDLIRLYPDLDKAIYKNSPDKNQQPIADGEVFQVEGATIRAVHAPGHSHDHMCFVLEEENAMFTGDNILGHGSSAVEELGVYMDTLRKMKGTGCTIGYPAHGCVIDNLQAKIGGELAQKVRRERQVLQALGEIRKKEKGMGRRKLSSVTVKELVTVIYGDKVGGSLRDQALEPFMDEVLRKLAEDGRVAFEMRHGEKKWFEVPA
jgi:glyoxylase-like metal-dependent hydrolase (beta-lactamase superfamily II)